MRSALSAIAVGALGSAALLLTVTDPEQPSAVAAFVFALALAAAAGTAQLFLMGGSRTRSRRRGLSTAELSALRRGTEVGALVGLLVTLRVIDGLTPLTAAFVLLAFGLAELALTVRTS